MARTPRPDLTLFHELNTKEVQRSKRIPWKERYEIIKREFPSSYKLDWHEAFKDIDLFGRIIRDILKADQSIDSRSGPGPRPILEPDRAKERLRQFLGGDYSYVPFCEALGYLAAGRSIRHLAKKIGVNPTLIFNLMHGKREPDLPLMEAIAAAFGKDPAFFMEYRIAFILGALGDRMDRSPETTVGLYRKLRSLGETDH